MVLYLIPVTAASAATVLGFVRNGFRGTPPEWIRVALLLSRLAPFGWLTVLLAA